LRPLILAFFLASLDVDINVAEQAGSALIAVQNLEVRRKRSEAVP
jgi:hypothetical protein